MRVVVEFKNDKRLVIDSATDIEFGNDYIDITYQCDADIENDIIRNIKIGHSCINNLTIPYF
jgi:hypothetical protein|uniref:Uncharacterized protein n=1 Tax=Siphoviridae sp. ctGuJ10 TaxID=2825418 RepID=A0A8S5PTS1_9CAUD|nr:MAG TPA: hypothetical protein [Siphoviridae sp. ctGuJ10]